MGETIGLSVLTGVSALLPDIDHPNSSIRNRMSFVGDLTFGWLKHRGVTHSLVAVVIVGLLMALVAPSRTLATAITLGYGSHLLADLITPDGIPLFMPLSRGRVRLPLIKTGSLKERILALFFVGLCLALVS